MIHRGVKGKSTKTHVSGAAPNRELFGLRDATEESPGPHGYLPVSLARRHLYPHTPGKLSNKLVIVAPSLFLPSRGRDGAMNFPHAVHWISILRTEIARPPSNI